MLISSTRSRQFFKAPQSVSSFVAAFMEPMLTVAVLFATLQWFGEPFDRDAKILSFLAITLTFPGRNRFTQRPLASGIEVLLGWCYVVAMLLIYGLVTESLNQLNHDMLLWWIGLTPLVHWVAVLLGRRFILIRSSQRWNRKRIVIVGASNLGVQVSQALRYMPVRTCDMLGFFDDRGEERAHPDALPHLVGQLKEVAAFVKAHGVHQVYITLPMDSQPRIVSLLEELQDTTASIYFVPDVFGISIIQGRLQDLNGVPVVGLCETPFTGMNEAVKRISDLVLSSVILMLIWPILLIVAIGVKLSSPGPIIFKQRRNGLDGEEIVVYKFRSMRTMDDGAVIKQAFKGDPRITPFGAVIRRTSLDELPQFINVLQGRMSIVGPRPHAVAHNEQYRKLIRAYMVRHKVKPGITGWAQVNGHRGETDSIDKMQARVEFDLAYLRNWSLSLDLQIVFKTVKLMLLDRHAY